MLRLGHEPIWYHEIQRILQPHQPLTMTCTPKTAHPPCKPISPIWNLYFLFLPFVSLHWLLICLHRPFSHLQVHDISHWQVFWILYHIQQDLRNTPWSWVPVHALDDMDNKILLFQIFWVTLLKLETLMQFGSAPHSQLVFCVWGHTSFMVKFVKGPHLLMLVPTLPATILRNFHIMSQYIT